MGAYALPNRINNFDSGPSRPNDTADETISTTVKVGKNVWKEFKKFVIDQDTSIEHELNAALKSHMQGGAFARGVEAGDVVEYPAELRGLIDTLLMLHSGKLEGPGHEDFQYLLKRIADRIQRERGRR